MITAADDLSVSVAVVGGGPAGCAAAIELRRLGVDVALFERSVHTQSHLGENLSGAARPLLAHLGALDDVLSAGHLSCAGISSAWGSNAVVHRESVFTPNGPGWLLDRHAFDAGLFSIARRNGARTFHDTRVVGCMKTNGGWSLTVSDRDLSRTRAVRASFVIDASGRALIVGRQMRALRTSLDRLAGFARTFEHADSRLHNKPLAFIEAVESGWWYSAPLPDDRLLVVYMTDVDLWRANGPESIEFWDRQLREATQTNDRVKPMRAVGKIRMAMADTYFVEVAGAGWLPVGTASMGLDPLSSEGLCFALRSGIAAGRAAAARLGGDALEEESFIEQRRGTFAAYLEERTRYYEAEERWTDSPFWRRRRTVATSSRTALMTTSGRSSWM